MDRRTRQPSMPKSMEFADPTDLTAFVTIAALPAALDGAHKACPLMQGHAVDRGPLRR